MSQANSKRHRITGCWVILTLLIVALSGCGKSDSLDEHGAAKTLAAIAAERSIAPVVVRVQALAQATSCQGTFIAHQLDHITLTRSQPVRMFETNGAGVAINDLDGDGWLDIVLANLNGPASILWNKGNLTFHRETLPDLRTRAVNIVDVDGDGSLDIVFTHVTSSLSFWRNLGTMPASFKLTGLTNVHKPAHAMAWGDLNGDNRLDLVTGSYDAELNLEMTNSFLFSDGAGIFYYEQGVDSFEPHRLALRGETLAIALLDFNGDGRRDIVVGNDFDIPDMAWRRTDDGWGLSTPFARTSHSTMSLDWGDIANNGEFALFATDMSPYDTSPTTWAQWLPMMESMSDALPSDDPQQTQNTLQVRNGDASFREESGRRGVIASGWSWSGKFGDLDNDGWLDLYIVNGMIDRDLFAHLPNQELVEQNQLFHNIGEGRFRPEPTWNTEEIASGRGLSMADLDHDGDLDMVINNLLSPATLLENRLCGGSGLELELYWPESGNSRALGAIVYVRGSFGILQRDVRAGSGYLSGDPARLHFGLPVDATVEELIVVWPDGATSTLANVESGQLYQLFRGTEPTG